MWILPHAAVYVPRTYCFLCRSTVVVPDAEPSYCLVYVYKDVKGNAQVLGVSDIAFGEGILENKEQTTEDLN